MGGATTNIRGAPRSPCRGCHAGNVRAGSRFKSSVSRTLPGRRLLFAWTRPRMPASWNSVTSVAGSPNLFTPPVRAHIDGSA